MSDFLSEHITPSSDHNADSYSVKELSRVLRMSIEDRFGYVKVRGEIGTLSMPASGHIYLTLKDDDQHTLAAVCWKSTANRLSVNLEEGMEVIATGKITTYAGQSKYQLVVQSIAVAGEGALLAMLEKRKKALSAEGLFDPSRKLSLPFLPQHIAVITSPTGAVIRDILHRLNDRFPRSVSVWPVQVQGNSASQQIIAAMDNIESLSTDAAVTIPDLIIIARGGGSIEDLMPFNDEALVRRVAACSIPVISAIGHETDTTLIDYVSDQRAPTPTAAAEMAVPERDILYNTVKLYSDRLLESMRTRLQHLQQYTDKTTLPSQHHLLTQKTTQLEQISLRQTHVIQARLQDNKQRLQHAAAQLLTPQHYANTLRHQLTLLATRLQQAWLYQRQHKQAALARHQLQPALLHHMQHFSSTQLKAIKAQLQRRITAITQQTSTALKHMSHSLQTVSYQQTLQRGFAVIRDQDNTPITSAQKLDKSQPFSIEFKDGVEKVES